MEGKTAKPIQSITPPPETESVDSLEIEWDIRRCLEKAGEIQTKIDQCTKGITFLKLSFIQRSQYIRPNGIFRTWLLFEGGPYMKNSQRFLGSKDGMGCMGLYSRPTV